MMNLITVTILLAAVSTFSRSIADHPSFQLSMRCTIAQNNFVDYNLLVQLIELNSEGGLLANGDHCDPFYFVGRQCNIGLQICIEILPE